MSIQSAFSACCGVTDQSGLASNVLHVHGTSMTIPWSAGDIRAGANLKVQRNEQKIWPTLQKKRVAKSRFSEAVRYGLQQKREAAPILVVSNALHFPSSVASADCEPGPEFAGALEGI